MDEDFGYVEGSKRNGSSLDSPIPPRDASKKGSNNPAELGEDLKMLKHIKASGRKSPSPSQSSSGNQEGSKKIDSDSQISLPQRFVVKYLGFRETSNLWGIKYTRRPVDEMVSDAKKVLSTTPDKALALLKLEVTEEGILVGPMPQNTNPNFPNGKFAIESISYGVQDLVYTRVFAIIVVKADAANVKLSELSAKGNGEQNGASGSSGGANGALPFRCHAFVCDSRQTARKLTYSLASAFSKFSKNVAEGKISMPAPKKFAIDLRSVEDIEADLIEADSEA